MSDNIKRMEFLEPPWLEELVRLKKEGKLFLTIRELSRISGVSPWTIRRLIKGGQIDAVKLRTQWVVYIDSFIEFTKNNYNLNLDD